MRKYFFILSFKSNANSSLFLKFLISSIISLSFSLSHIDCIILSYLKKISLKFKQIPKNFGIGFPNSCKRLLFQKTLLKYTKSFFIFSEYSLIDLIPSIISSILSLLRVSLSSNSKYLKYVSLLSLIIYLL